MKKNIIKSVIALVFVVGAIYFNVNIWNHSNITTDVANIIANNVANAIVVTVDGCDSDPEDICFSEMGELLAFDCDPSTWWDTCKKEVDGPL